ncbi:integrase family protein [Catenulispora acidiphila DSM 44928]|uniref:Integrase family protein n=1 Tax=Catenulispora acidiphila (strain DSM 44928 / JCM 14897 / NBRC 102108 / NRRL B-24433 / ID139908) TaxID=479433 RepID=C7Q3X3_CATAD|nr:site-specific integrase [Catenulispora acidiphila]ACU77731.1 integrase family protein [Catenulispora acidiphila DSM 44928]
MGWVRKRISKNGTERFVANYRDIRGNTRSAGTYSTEKQAEDAAKKAENDIAAGRIGDPKRGRQKFRAYVLNTWLPNHEIECSTRQTYTYLINKHILPEFGGMRMVDVLPEHVREWMTKMAGAGVSAQSRRNAKVAMDAILTTAFNDQVTFLHAGQGVKRPTVAKKTKRIITAEQYDKLHAAIGESEHDGERMQLLTETDIETGMRWGELTEFRVKDLDPDADLITIARAVVKLDPKFHPQGKRFLVKDYPKDGEWRELKISRRLTTSLVDFAARRGLGSEDLFFEYVPPTEPKKRRRPDELPDPITLGWTEPHPKSGRQYRHGTISAYSGMKCRCQFCRDAMSAYRAERRAIGKDAPRNAPRHRDTDGHIDGDWFRKQIFYPAVEAAGISFKVTPKSLRDAHASWLLAGGADLQVAKERLGHGSITTTEQYLGTLPGAGEAALAALDAFRGRGAVADQAEPMPTAAEAVTPDMASVLKMMEELKLSVDRLAA